MPNVQRRTVPSLIAAICLGVFAIFHASGATAAADPCTAAGQWTVPATGQLTDAHTLLGQMARKKIVLLGEYHANADHHRWQLYVLSGLLGRNRNMVLGFESFPRSVQPVLDRWIRGELNEQEFLKQSGWNEHWRYDSDLYLPLFHFARLNRIPMVALNVDRALIARTGRDGWNAIPADERFGIGDPAKPEDDYLRYLAGAFSGHGNGTKSPGHGNGTKSPGHDPATASPATDDSAVKIPDTKRFRRFVQAQGVWDRAMAEKLAQATSGTADTLVVGIIGGGHLEYRYGVPHQLAALGIKDAMVLLPWGPERVCADFTSSASRPIADAVFGILPEKSTHRPAPPRLGVVITKSKGDKGGVRIERVVDGSIAAATGLKPKDIIVKAAGVSVGDTAALVTIIQRQAPGTWLPLRIRRDGGMIDITAKFPSRANTPAQPSPPTDQKHPTRP